MDVRCESAVVMTWAVLDSAEAAAAEARFLAHTFRPRSLFSPRAWSSEPPDDEASISYQDLAAALERPGTYTVPLLGTGRTPTHMHEAPAAVLRQGCGLR